MSNNTGLIVKKDENNIVLDKKDVITLNKEKRKLLIGLVPKIIDMSVEIKAFEDARDSAVKELNKFIKLNLPEADMQILEKYEHISAKTQIRPTKKDSGCGRGYRTCKFYFEVGEFKCPIEFSSTSDWSNLKWREVSDKLFAQCEDVENLHKQLEIIKNKKINSYISLINNSKTLNQVAVIWEDVAEHLKGELPLKVSMIKTISDEEINTVKEDVKRRVV